MRVYMAEAPFGIRDLVITDPNEYSFENLEKKSYLDEAQKQNAHITSIALKAIQNPDKNNVENVFRYTAEGGHDKIMEFLFINGLRPDFEKNCVNKTDYFYTSYTAMRHAIVSRQRLSVETLIKHEFRLDQTSRDPSSEEGILEAFFYGHRFKGANPAFLEFLLERGGDAHTVSQKTIFDIATIASPEELSLLLNNGLNPNSLYSFSEAMPPMSLLDLSVMIANFHNSTCEDLPSIEKVSLLLKKGADIRLCSQEWDQNYLHNATHPELVRFFAYNGINIRERSKGVHCKEHTPIESTYIKETVNTLIEFGESPANSPFIKGSEAHKKALERVGFTHWNLYDGQDDEGELFLIKAYKQKDIGAFIALISAGIDINTPSKVGSKNTCLHHLFEKIRFQHNDPSRIFIHLATENLEIRLINILLMNKARPTKNSEGKTPLMLLNFTTESHEVNYKIIDLYIDNEAKFHNIKKDYYRNIFNNTVKHKNQTTELIEKFWNEIENHKLPPEEF